MKDKDNRDQETANEVTKSLDELRKVESDIVELALALTRDRMEMGEVAMAMRLDTFIDHIKQALGEMPRPGEKKEDFDARREKLRKAAEAAIQAASDTPPEAIAAAKAALEEDAAPTTPEAETKPSWLEVRKRGMKFSRFSTPTRRTLIAKEEDTKRGSFPARLHKIEVRPAAGLSSDFMAEYSVNGELKFSLLAHSPSKAESCALVAAKEYMRRSAHRGRKLQEAASREDEGRGAE